MKKIVLASVIFFILLIAASTPLVNASEDQKRPKGLEDKGPLTKITFIHYKKGAVKPSAAAKPKTISCYDFLANGAKWKTTEDYLINPTNDDGMSDAFVLDAVTKGTDEWSHQVAFPIFGNAVKDNDAAYSETLDDKNVVAFGDYPDSNVIAITSVWGYFYGSPKTRQLVEWDMLFNTKFSWGDGGDNSALMDLQNIATHELGHSAGMDDLYTSSCTLETMYGYSTEGEISKRDLYTGDIKGIQELYR